MQPTVTKPSTFSAPSTSGARPRVARRLLAVAAFLALAAGIAEAAYYMLAYRLWQEWMPASPQIVWMTPLTNLLLIAVPAVVVALIAARAPRLVPAHIAAGVLAACAAMMLVLLFPMIHRFAKLALIAGFALQIARVYRARPQQFDRFVRRGIAFALIAVAFATVVVNARTRWSGWQDLRALPATREGAPNVILFILDTVRAQSMSVYGYGRRTTPELERLAQRGTVFDRAYSTTSWTLPSHASMFTGRYPQELSADWERPLDSTYPTIAEVLRDAGYETAGFVANVAYTTRQTGIDRGFLRYQDYPATEIFRASALSRKVYTHPRLRQLTGYYDNVIRKRAPRVNRDLLAWLSKRDEDRPFFAFVNYMDAHQPYLPPDPFRTMFGPDSARDLTATRFASPFGGAYLPSRNRMSTAQHQAETDAYDASIASIDAAMGELLRELERRDILNNTVIIVAADHGEHLGEDARFGHGSTLYDQVLRVPLLIVHPESVPAGRRIGTPVTTRDVAATIAEAAGLPASSVGGSSLARMWNGTVHPQVSPILARVSRGVRARPAHGMTAIIVGNMHYIRSDDGSEELYDLATDPGESFNLASRAEYATALHELKDSLTRTLGGLQQVHALRMER